MAKSALEEKFIKGLLLYSPFGTDGLVRQHKFHPTRRWRLDFAWPLVKVAVEIDGYGPGHTNAKSRRNDCEKQNALILRKWRILRYTSNHLTLTRIEATVDEVISLISCSKR